jgi:hypothetical protein
LEEEMAEHLGYDKHDPAGRNRGNSRNGKRAKTVLTDSGEVAIEVPRDRDGSFEPVIVAKRQRRLSNIDEIVLSLHARGLITGDIAAHFAEIYDAQVSKDTISRITDRVVEEMQAWTSRPLEPAYAAVFTAVEKAWVELGGAGVTPDTEWVHRVSEACEGDDIRSLIASLAVEALPVHGEVTVRYVIANSAALQLLTVMRTIAALKSKLQRTNPVEEQHKYNQMFSELVVLEARRKALHTRGIGAAD